MKSFEATGRTVEEAVNAGLSESGLSIGEVNVQILDEGSKGLFGLFGSRMARVRLVPREEQTGGDTRELFRDSLREKPASRPSEPARTPERPAPEARPAQPERPVMEQRPPRPERPAMEQRPPRPERPAMEPRPPRPERPAREPRTADAPAIPPAETSSARPPRPRAPQQNRAGEPRRETPASGRPQGTASAKPQGGGEGAPRDGQGRRRTPRAEQPGQGQHDRAPRNARPRAAAPEREQGDENEGPVVTPASLIPRNLAEVPDPEPGSPEGIVRGFLLEMTRLMGMDIHVVMSKDEDGHVYARMDGDPQGILIGRRGETLDAMQYLASLKVNRGREDYVRVTLDSEGYRKKREEALVRLANRMANRARKTGRRVNMEPMNPYERRIFHSALQAIPGIATHSEGEEPNRHVVITPVPVSGAEAAETQETDESSD